MNDKQRILVVDDEPQITLVLRSGLVKHGYEVRVASEGEAALELFRAWTPDLVITDLSMPNVDGVELCRRLRAFSGVPVIVLSVKGEEGAKIEALDAGADDYVTKPFGMGELLARVRAALRRAATPVVEAATVVEAGGVRTDLEERSVTVRGQEVRLSPKEFDLLIHFMRNPGKVLTHHTLLCAVWGEESVDETECLRVFVGQLRKKVEPQPAMPRYVLTEPWIGYRFDPGS